MKLNEAYYCQGNYGLLPRILFYCTLVFALVAKHHDWLIGGALAAALTYSGSAAIHACILIWRGPSYGDSDVQALVGTYTIQFAMFPMMQIPFFASVLFRPCMH